ncbi:MAG: hypothetical protein ACYS99_21520 [Planctomycetota bacterium]|jgi:hypothetical protein
MSRPDRPEEESMSTKELVLRAIRELPDDASLEEILDTILLRMKVQRGREQILGGEGITHAEVRERLARWLG